MGPAILYLLYLISGLIGLRLGAVGTFATPVWYPSGIALGFLFLFGRRCIPAVALGAFTVNLVTGASWSMAFMIACGNTLEAVAGAGLLKRTQDFHPALDRPRDVLVLLFYAALLSTLISAGCGTLALGIHRIVGPSDLAAVFSTWWQGDMMGILLVTPLLLVWSASPAPWRQRPTAQMIVVAAAATGMIGIILFAPPHLLPLDFRETYLLFAFLIWIACRFEIHGVTLCTFLMSVLALWGTMQGHGPFQAATPVRAGINVQFFFSVASITALIVGAIVRQRRLLAEDILRNSEMQARMAAIVESTDDAVIGKSPQGIVTSWNRGAEKLFGYTAAEMMGQPILRVVPHLLRDVEDQILERIRRGERIEQLATQRRRKDGTLLDIALTISPIYNAAGRVIGASSIARDITLQKTAEAALRERSQELERLTRTKSDFVTMVTHELRTPLSAIKEGIAIVLDGIDGAINPHQQRTLEIVKRNVDRLGRLVANVLDFQRFEGGLGQMRHSSADTAALVHEVMETFRFEAGKKGVRLAIDAAPPVPLVCDVDRIKQVLINLVDNALKFTEPGGSVMVGVQPAERDVTFDVRDTGVGIRATEQAKVFEMFGQVEHQGMSKMGGFGVGLAVCKLIINAHGGRIGVESAEGRGSRFFFVIPKQPPPAAGADPG
ncbi:MAG: MASE1 domain-containing protein [Deltaproteobacteria bacterium]|nr:MASE1 domain-containing protein [Deltaproteobacteria bacterium]